MKAEFSLLASASTPVPTLEAAADLARALEARGATVHWVEDALGDRGAAEAVLGVHDVLEQDLLRALLLAHHLVVRQVERRGLHAAAGVTGGVDLLHHADRGVGAAVRVLVNWVEESRKSRVGIFKKFCPVK